MAYSRREWIASAASAVWLQPPAEEPAAEPAPTFSMDVNLVTVGFTVRDRSGNLASTLSEKDFEVYEDGERQVIKRFLTERETPLTVGIVLDRSPSQDQFEQENVYAAITFFRRVLREEDRAFAAAFGNKIKLVSDLTSSKEELERSLKRMGEDYDRAPWVGPRIERKGGSAVLDAVYWPAKEKLASATGRKALIMIGDGRENASKVNLVEIIDLLQSRDILFYGIDNGGEDSDGNRRLRNLMPVIAKESGGREFKLSQTDLQRAFEEIENELRTLYTIAYTPTNHRRDGRFRRLEVRPVDKRLEVRARPGYYAR